MMNIIKTIKNWLNPVYSMVYTDAKGETQMYTITKPKHRNEFGNQKQGREVVGFRAFCYNREGIRSFRYDRIVSLTRG